MSVGFGVFFLFVVGGVTMNEQTDYDIHMDGRTNERTNKRTEQQTNERTNRRIMTFIWTNERMNKPTNERTNEWKNRQIMTSIWTDERTNERTNERTIQQTKERPNEKTDRLWHPYGGTNLSTAFSFDSSHAAPHGSNNILGWKLSRHC